MDTVGRAIEQWEREMSELNLLAMALVGRLKVTSRLVQRDFLEPFFKKHGLQAGEFDVLATLRRSGAPYALGPTQLYEALLITSGGMTNRLDRLEKAGLIARTPNPDDRRGTLVSLTDQGLEIINRIVPLHVENETQAMAGLSRNEQETLNRLLGKLIAGLEAP
ncbi:MarR family winged helix-turn-helix transcriptional regulator [Modicisalibacter luteus]|uniref:MarR family winged helix-turn-helix transcriptional regulator n=1 Tax=Modicisalibacter luteus TaxID=453962 RepID=A0ABV7M4C7_9GAMM|nr:MarR family transcriptional regulator [Halomonas lutea]GHA86164.1 MarR family transcriptional regulator [Halomonas lutea]